MTRESVGRSGRGTWWAGLALGLAAVTACSDTLKPEEKQEQAEEPQVCTSSTPPPPEPASACRAGWCFVTPQPTPMAFSAAWSIPGGTTWLVGASGTVVRARGADLEPLDSGTGADLYDVWASSDTDVWASGADGTLLHWDGARWQPQAVPTTVRLHALAGSSGSDVWVAGTGGLLLHRDGEQWVRVATGEPGEVLDLASAGPGEVWASVGGRLLRCGASGCQRAAAPPEVDGTTYAAVTLLGFPGGELVVLGTTTGEGGTQPEGALLRWQEGAWTRLLRNQLLFTARFRELAASGPQELWLAYGHSTIRQAADFTQLTHVVGTSVTNMPLPEGIGPASPAVTALAAPAPGELYALRTQAAHLRYTQGQPSELIRRAPVLATPDLRTPRALELLERITDVAVLADGQVAFATNKDLPSWGLRKLSTDPSGASWTAAASRTPFYTWEVGPGEELTLQVTRTDATGTHESYASRKPFFGGARTSGPGPVVAGIHAQSESNVWVVSASDLLRWDGTQWTSVAQVEAEAPPRFTGDVWSASPTKVWVAGVDGVLFWDGERLAPVGPTGFRVAALWGSSSSDVWAVGAPGVAHHWDGSAWTALPLPAGALTAGKLVDVVGRCATDVDVVAERAVFHWNGAQWTVRPLRPEVTARFAAAVGPELWVVAGAQDVAHAVLRSAP